MAGIFGPVLVNYIREYNITHGVPKAQAYNITMYIMAGLFVIGFFAIDLTCRLFAGARPRSGRRTGGRNACNERSRNKCN